MAAPPRKLEALPYEIISHICEFLDCTSLKQCRLVNHIIECPASEALFLTVHITTTIDSLEHAQSIGRSSKHNTKSKTIVYHASSVISGPHGSLDEPTDTSHFGSARNSVEFTDLINSMRGSSPLMGTNWDDLIPKSIDQKQLWRDYEGIWRARRDLESHGYVSQRLRALLRLFPNITAIHLAPLMQETPYIPGEHIPILSRVDEDAFTDVLSATYDREIKCLSAVSLHWGSFRLCNNITVLCGSLRELDLTIEDRQIKFPYSHMREDFAIFLGLCRNLEVLKLEISNCEPIESCFLPIAAACSMMMEITWSRLERVKLVNIITDARSIETFLTNNSRTLRSVRFERFRLPELMKGIPPGETVESVDYLSTTLRSCQNACEQLGDLRVDGEYWLVNPSWMPAGEVEPLIGLKPFYYDDQIT